MSRNEMPDYNRRLDMPLYYCNVIGDVTYSDSCFAEGLKVVMRADYERMAHEVMPPYQFRFREDTYGYRTIDSHLKAYLERTNK